MASQIRRLLISTRERITSTDLNDAHSLQHRALTEGLAWALRGDQAGYGVVGGLQVTSTGALGIAVAPGLALQRGAAATTYDSATQWLELGVAQVVDLASYVDATNPRWVCVEIAAADAVELSTSRDIWQPASGTFISGSVDKVRGSAPVITVTAGTPAATAYFPAGVANRIPLAYVYLPAAAASISEPYITMCRPMIRPLNVSSWLPETGAQVRGGGVSVPLAAAVVRLHHCLGQFASANTPFSIGESDGYALTGQAAGAFDGASLPGADAVVYFYAAAPPYPSGYDTTLAPREFRPSDQWALDPAMYPNLVPESVYGCIVVASTVAPTVDTITGHPAAGNFTITSAPWSSGSVNVSRFNSVYLGAAFYDFSALDFVNQSCVGDRVFPKAFTVGADNVPHLPETQIHNGTVFIANSSTLNLWSSAASSAGGVSGGVQLPVTAYEVECNLFAIMGTATSAFFGMSDITCGNTIPGFAGRSREFFALGGGENVCTYNPTFYPSAIGEITWDGGTVAAATTDLTSLHIVSRCYRDAILAKR